LSGGGSPQESTPAGASEDISDQHVLLHRTTTACHRRLEGVTLRVLEIRQTQTTKLACPEELGGSVSIRIGLLNVEVGRQFHSCDFAERIHAEHIFLKLAVVKGIVESTHICARLLDFFFQDL